MRCDFLIIHHFLHLFLASHITNTFSAEDQCWDRALCSQPSLQTFAETTSNGGDPIKGGVHSTREIILRNQLRSHKKSSLRFLIWFPLCLSFRFAYSFSLFSSLLFCSLSPPFILRLIFPPILMPIFNNSHTSFTSRSRAPSHQARSLHFCCLVT